LAALRDYRRHGTTSLFTALEVASSKVHGRCYRQHRHHEFVTFLDSVARRYRARELSFDLLTITGRIRR
jgi:hypothetical protein